VVSNENFKLSSTCSTQLAPAASCTATVTFEPEQSGSLYGAVTVTASELPGLAKTVSFSGKALVGELRATPNTLDFGRTGLDVMSSMSTEIENKGEATSNITGALIQGEHAEHFE